MGESEGEKGRAQAAGGEAHQRGGFSCGLLLGGVHGTQALKPLTWISPAGQHRRGQRQHEEQPHHLGSSKLHSIIYMSRN